MFIPPTCNIAALENSGTFIKGFRMELVQRNELVYLRFFGPCLVGVRNEDGGGRVGDVGEIRRADKSLRNDAEVVNV